MTVTYDATHRPSSQVSPMTRLICHLCRELTHPFAHRVSGLRTATHQVTNSSGFVTFVFCNSLRSREEQPGPATLCPVLPGTPQPVVSRRLRSTWLKTAPPI